MVLALCMLANVVNIYMKTHENILNILKLKFGHDRVTKTTTFKVQRGITKKVHKQELQLLHSASRLIVLNICMKFHDSILNNFNVIERTSSCHRNCYLQGSRIHKQELWFLRSARRPIELNICMKFHEDILNVFKLERGHNFVTDRQPWQKQCLPIRKVGGVGA